MSDEGLAGTTAGSNVANRKEIIRNACKELDAIDVEMEPLKTRVKEIKGRIKADLDMKLTDFNAIRRVYKLEGDDRDAFLDTLREGLEALEIAWPR